jgi:hypothetical protein
MVEMIPGTALLDPCAQEQVQQRIGACIGLAVAAMAVCHEQSGLVFILRQYLREGADG